MYDFLLARYEQAASRADLLERQQAELNGALKKNWRAVQMYSGVPGSGDSAVIVR